MVSVEGRRADREDGHCGNRRGDQSWSGRQAAWAPHARCFAEAPRCVAQEDLILRQEITSGHQETFPSRDRIRARPRATRWRTLACVVRCARAISAYASPAITRARTAER